jgi:nodulation protein E
LPADIDFVSTHGTATLFNDLMEAQALSGLFGERASSVPVNSIKGSIGHSLGAAGALEAVMAVRVLEEQLIPPTAGHVNLDPNINLDVVAGAPRRAIVRRVLSTSSGFGGVNAALVFSDGKLADRKDAS